MTGTLEHRASRSADHLVYKGETREGRDWERSAKEKTDESRNPQREFFFLHCRTSARHCRSTTGMSEERNQISPKAKANKNQHTNQTKQHPQDQTRQRSREICKLGETGETSASLSSPSQVLFRQVVFPTLSMFRCLPYQCLHQDTQASLEHLVDVAV